MTTPGKHGYETFIPNAGRTQLTAVFPDRAEARHVINDLRAFGLRLDQLSVAMRDPGQQDRLVVDTGLRASDGAISTASVRSQSGLRGFMAGLRSSALPHDPSPGAAIDDTRPGTTGRDDRRADAYAHVRGGGAPPGVQLPRR